MNSHGMHAQEYQHTEQKLTLVHKTHARLKRACVSGKDKFNPRVEESAVLNTHRIRRKEQIKLQFIDVKMFAVCS